MAHNVTKTGPFYASGSITFSSLRNNFRDKNQVGPISASELRRNTNVTNIDPVVPDSTENSSISSFSNLALSTFRNSIKYYYITQTGNNTSTVQVANLTWNSNLSKNIRKWYFVQGNITHNNPNQPALNLQQSLSNMTFDISGTVKGAGGLRGGDPPSNNSFDWPNSATVGGPGGDAITISNTGSLHNNVTFIIGPAAQVYGGGGGGGKGNTGATGPNGACYEPRVTGGTYSNGWGEWYSYSRGGSCQCEWYIGCGNYLDHSNNITIDGVLYQTRPYNNGQQLQIGNGSYRSHRSNGGCNCWGWRSICHNTCIGQAYCGVEDPISRPGGPGGAGGNGGLGQGNNQNQSVGLAGAAGTPKNCPTYGADGINGSNGGQGGNWGQNGSAGLGSGGAGGGAGAAISGANYTVTGSTGSSNIKGSY